ncbi:uncharacterized protein EI97DRAFT_72134 [Westerdykella ornata]|uniref:Uncharacterized protein n=1 Tax=Westerdykella ornata TaxID=318751 RepID=A0A6A6JI51_WESOR|nr:uncharacterized protein EI97DRAFT_72134 [Westerdykella ornata]KAF2275316.1 hypothetical protein EI97DRAFT_72134 [Westerdykella ornata]
MGHPARWYCSTVSSSTFEGAVCTHSSSGIGEATSDPTDATGFLACATGVLDADPKVDLVVVDGRAVAVRVEEPSEARGAVLVVEASAAVRELRGRFGAEVAEGVIVDLRSVVDVLPGEALAAAAEDNVVLRAAAFLFSSPEVTEERSGSASDAVDLEANLVLLAAVPGAGRVGGLFKLDPVVLVRVVELERGFDAVVEERDVLDATAGLRPAAVAAEVTSGRRGAAVSALEVEAELEEAIVLRAAVEEGVAVFFCSWGAWSGPLSAAAPGRSAMIPGLRIDSTRTM